MKKLPSDLRPKAIAIVHTLSDDDAVRLVQEIRGIGLGGLHFTDEVDGGYTKWPVMWTKVVQKLGGEDSK
jgi:hypothetical protein